MDFELVLTHLHMCACMCVCLQTFLWVYMHLSVSKVHLYACAYVRVARCRWLAVSWQLSASLSIASRGESDWGQTRRHWMNYIGENAKMLNLHLKDNGNCAAQGPLRQKRCTQMQLCAFTWGIYLLARMRVCVQVQVQLA